MITIAKDQLIEQITSIIDKLPPMPANISRLRQAAANPRANYNTLLPILKEDPGLCTDLLRFANSAIYAVGHEVLTVDEAIRYFGMSNLVNFVATSFVDKVVRKYFSHVKNLNEFHTHSLEISRAAALIAKAAGKNKMEQDSYAVAGLLHDIGKLVLLVVSDDKCYRMMGDWNGFHEVINDEDNIFGLSHCCIGAKICRRWEFPESLLEAVELHHQPLKDDHLHKDAAYIFLAHLITIPDMPDNIISMALSDEIYTQLNLTPEKVFEAKESFFKQNE